MLMNAQPTRYNNRNGHIPFPLEALWIAYVSGTVVIGFVNIFG